MASEELKTLEDIRRLLIFILLKQGFKQGEVADALGVTQPTISKMFSKNSKIKKTESND